jgi:hypothetical protein
MITAKGTMKVRCDKCQKVHIIESEETDFEITNSQERQMGPENEYGWEESIECECGNEIEITCEVWEYPEGAINNSQVTVINGTLIQDFEYDIL